MHRVYAMGHHYGGYDGEDYDEMCEYAHELMKKLDEIEEAIEKHSEHHRRGGYSTRSHREGGYGSGHRDGYEMYDEGHRRGRRSYGHRRGEHYVRGHYSR